MRKKILPLGILLLGFSVMKAQEVLTFVGSAATVNVKNGATFYSGGTVSVAGTGIVQDEGDFKIDNGDFKTEKDDGSNFVIKQNQTSSPYNSYGQLWINNSSQSKVTGKVKKEYQADKHGAYQQIALPFNDKAFSELSSELGKTFSTSRWSENEILVYNNAKVESDHIKDLSSKTNSTSSSSGNYKSSYYMLGAKGMDISTMHILTGVPYSSDNSTVSLSGASEGVNFGSNGNNRNSYRERYSTYMYDAFYSYSTSWEGTYGKNIYQFGNPFLTNLDLTKISSDLQTKIQGIRVAVSDVKYGRSAGTTYAKYKYVTFTGTGSPVGDVDLAIIKPLQTFVVKMKDGQTGSLDLATLRTFAYKGASLLSQGEEDMVIQSKNRKDQKLNLLSNGFKQLSKSKNSSVKQLGIIALDEDGNELGRAYYAVYPNAHTGTNNFVNAQVTASSTDVIGTYEENINGGYDEDAANAYWLYINEANESNYKGKDILLALYSDKIKKVKFEIRENAERLNEGETKLSNRESFYIDNGQDLLAVKQGEEYPVSGQFYRLYYGMPDTKSLGTTESLQKPSNCVVVFDKDLGKHRLIFDPNWIEADVKVFDASGRLIIHERDHKTSNDLVISLPDTTSTYVVTAVSKKGEKFSQKIIK